MAAKTQLKNVEGKKSQQRGGKKSRREHKLSPALRDALITDCVLWNIAKSEKGRCTNDDIHKLLAQHGIALNAVTRCFKKMADGIPEKKIAPLPFFFRYDEGKELAGIVHC